MKIKTLQCAEFELRPVKMADAKRLVELLNDSAVTRYMESIPYPYGPKDARSWLAKTLPEYRKKLPSRLPLAIDYKGELIGMIGHHRIKSEHMAEIGYWLGRDYWGSGIMSKALKIVGDHCFNELHLIRLEARVFAGNKGSERVLTKNGFKLEGKLKKAAKKNGKIYDVLVYGKVK